MSGKTTASDLQEKILRTGEDAGKIIQYLRETAPEGLPEEIPFIRLKLAFVRSEYEKYLLQIEAEMEKIEKKDLPERDPAKEMLLAQLKATTENELAWIGEMLGTLNRSMELTDLAAEMKKTALGEKLKKKLGGD